MAEIRVETARTIAAAPARVFACIADYARHRPHWLPPAYSDLKVEQGGSGAGTMVAYKLKVGPRERVYQMRVSEPEPGRRLVEQDTASSLVTTWTVTPAGSAGSEVRVVTTWQGAGGVGGFFERRFAPGGLRGVYDDALTRLERYAGEQSQ